ncbi:ApeP family dehydratase [Thalassotalea marina]|uniref:Thioester dehydrase n=1 Tax=Thalassotalea marina TaxID=1673741 RepID=A0A919BK46_9GAMM|nr:hotdog family protein [Thalassotalea marina]GHF97092.1 thioester dehydrase [Thalassotalea marina]
MKNYAIEEVIAHREPMILLSRLTHYTADSATCEVDILPTSPFYQEQLQGVPSYIGIEYMAQTIAAFAGANALDKDKKIDIGFLLGSRKYQTFQPAFELGESYQVHVEELYRDDSGLTVFECKIERENQVIAQAKVNAFQPENPIAFLKEQ